MNDVAIAGPGTELACGGVLPPSSEALIAAIRKYEDMALTAPQIDLVTHHVIHAGVYSRTIMIPKGVVLTSALIKIPTTLVVCGKCSVAVGDAREVLIDGYHVFAASAGRKQVYVAHEDTFVTMSFKTDAKDITQAEEEFTDEADRLLSRQGANDVIITGE